MGDLFPHCKEHCETKLYAYNKQVANCHPYSLQMIKKQKSNEVGTNRISLTAELALLYIRKMFVLKN